MCKFCTPYTANIDKVNGGNLKEVWPQNAKVGWNVLGNI